MAKKNISRYECLPLSVRDVINNALMKDSIVALCFDFESKHKYVVPKFMIPMVIEIMDDIQSGHINPEDYMKYGVGDTALPSLGWIFPRLCMLKWILIEVRKNTMTDKMFMSMLDSASKEKLTPINFASFMHILIQGYSEDLGLLGLYAVENGCTMILTVGTPDRKILNFLTNREYYYKLKRNMPPSNREKVNAQLFSCRRIINDVLDDESIAGICFNATENNHVTVEKEILTAYIQEGLLVKITDQ